MSESATDAAPLVGTSLDFDLSFSVSTQTRLLTAGNAGAQRLFATQTFPLALDAVLHADDIVMLDELTPRLRSGQPWTGVLRLRATALGQRKLQAVVMADQGDPEDITLTVAACELTRPDQVLAELAHRATHDYLTGLPNRALLLDRLTLALARARRHQRPVALMFIDLDNFKLINDRLGHAIGDEVLVTAAHNMAQALRPSDTIARMGGDEFVVLCSEVNAAADAELIAARVRRELEAISHPVNRCSLTASFGVIVSLTGDIDTEDLLAAADRAMYQAKASGGGQIMSNVLPDPTLEITPPPGPDAVRAALMAGELTIGVTPVIDLRTGFIAQVEVAPMWEGYSGSRYDARDLVSEKEDADLCALLDTWLVQAAANTHEMFATACGNRAPRVTACISSATTLDPHFAAVLDDALAPTLPTPGANLLDLTTPVAPRWNAVGLELGGTALANAGGQPADALDWLEDRGVSLTATDFSTEAVPTAWLANGITRTAKITLPATNDAPQMQSFSTAVRAAHSLHLGVIAQGVSTTNQLDQMLHLGCDAAQGPVFGDIETPAGLVPLINGRQPIDFW